MRLVAALLSGLLAFGSASAAEPPSASLRPLEALLQRPAEEIDLLEAKLVVDQLIAPDTDPAAVRRQIEALVTRARARIPAGASNLDKLNVLLATLYEPGPWNVGKPFQYDLDDPFGRNIENKLLSTYLATLKGNCVSMPVLFAIVGQRLGLSVTLATAPNHVMVKYRADDGGWMNVEATAGGFKYDSSYERETGISAKAIETGIYLRPLSQRESVAVIMSSLMEHYGKVGLQDKRIAVADLALKMDPRDVVAMQHKGAAYYLLLQELFVRPYPDPNDIPGHRRDEFFAVSQENLRWYAEAERLGWVPPTPEGEARYIESIRRERKLKRGGLDQ
jgi:regulator of sirC expression with transglutaminase-like and TPR domain